MATSPAIKDAVLVSLEAFNAAVKVLFNQDVVINPNQSWDFSAATAVGTSNSTYDKYDFARTEVYVTRLDDGAGPTSGYYIEAGDAAIVGQLPTGEIRVLNTLPAAATYRIRVIAFALPATLPVAFVPNGVPYHFYDSFTTVGDAVDRVADVGGAWSYEDFLFQGTPMTMGAVGGELVRTSNVGQVSEGSAVLRAPRATGTHDMVAVETTFILPNTTPFYAQFSLTIEQELSNYAGFGFNYFRSTNPNTHPLAGMSVSIQPNEDDYVELLNSNTENGTGFTELALDTPHTVRLEMQPGLWRCLLNGVVIASSTSFEWMFNNPNANLYVECEQIVAGGSRDAPHFTELKFDATRN